MDARKAGALIPARIVSLSEFRSGAGFDAAFVARLFVVTLALAVAFWVWRRVKEDRRVIVLSVVLVVHGYAFFGTSVHENHTFLAVVLVPLLLGEWKHARPALVATSGFLFASLLCAAGFGRRITGLPEVMSGRMVLGLDLQHPGGPGPRSPGDGSVFLVTEDARGTVWGDGGPGRLVEMAKDPVVRGSREMTRSAQDVPSERSVLRY